MFPNDPNNVARMAQLLKNPQYLNMLASKMGQNGTMPSFLPGGQPTLIHHPTAGTTISSSHGMPPNMATLIAQTALQQQQQHQQQQQQQQANATSTTARIPPPSTTANLIPNGASGGAAVKWHDDLSKNTRQELFNTIVEIKTGKSFNGDKSSIDGNLSKSILAQISRIWKQTNSKEQFAQELSQWLASENPSFASSDLEKKLLDLMNKSQKPTTSSSVGVENLFGMMTTAASSIGTNSSFPNITNPINAKNPNPGPNGGSTTTTSTTTTSTSNTTATTTTTTSTITPSNATSIANVNNTNSTTSAPVNKKISQQEIDKYLGFIDFLKQHEDMIKQYIRTVAAQHTELSKRLKAISTLTPEEISKMKQGIQKNQMILAESKSLDKLLSLTSKEERLKFMEGFTTKSFAFAVHIKDVIEKKLKTPKDAAQPPVVQPPPTTTTTTTTTTPSTSTNNATGPASTAPPSTTSVTSSQSSTNLTPPPTTTNPPPVQVQPPTKKEPGDDGFYNLKKIGESSIITFNQDSFYSALGEMNIKNLTQPTKRKLIPESTEHEKVLKKIKTPIDILQNNLTNLIEFDNIIEFKTSINIKSIEDARYQLDFIINPIEKGILNLPILSLCVIVNHNEIIPYSISFSHNYANEKNSLFVNIRKYFNNLLIENTTCFINTSEILSTHNNTYHIQRYNLSLNCILNSWITSINTVVKKELQ